MVIKVKNGVTKLSSDSHLVRCIHFHTDTFGKDMNPSDLPPVIGKIAK